MKTWCDCEYGKCQGRDISKCVYAFLEEKTKGDLKKCFLEGMDMAARLAEEEAANLDTGKDIAMLIRRQIISLGK